MDKHFLMNIGKFQSTVDEALQQIARQNIIERIGKHDHTVWKDDPAEITNRLAWLHSPETMVAALPEIYSFVDEVRSAGFTRALLLGMGGSSLAPEVFRFTFGVTNGYLEVAVLDSTHPGAVREMEQTFDPPSTLYIVSTKSGGTVETLSFAKYFYNSVMKTIGRESAGKHFAAITDPGSGLEAFARELKFRKIFLNDPHIGGRYSALSYFGLVPAALLGADVNLLLERARSMAHQFKNTPASRGGENTSVLLGAILGELALAGRNKITLVTSPELSSFGAWVEQLIAESTGKEGRGILPVDRETLLAPEFYAVDRLFVYLKLKGDSTFDEHINHLNKAGFPTVQITLDEVYDLGGEFFRWEIATIIASRFLNINPFDQPDVESAKIQARNMMAAYQKEGKLPALKPSLTAEGIIVYADFSSNSLESALNEFLAKSHSGSSYAALHVYLKPSSEIDAALQELRAKIQQKYRLAVTAGYGPRFLHSTGQLHKGDAGRGLFIQFTADITEDAAIPDTPGKNFSSASFGVLINAQALGDRQALLDKGRKVIRFHLGKDVVGGLKRLAETL